VGQEGLGFSNGQRSPRGFPDTLQTREAFSDTVAWREFGGGIRQLPVVGLLANPDLTPAIVLGPPVAGPPVICGAAGTGHYFVSMIYDKNAYPVLSPWLFMPLLFC
jgi:hypothetical protein